MLSAVTKYCGNKSKMAAARSRAVVAIQRALKKQSYGGREGRFAVNRTLLNLKRCQVKLGEDVSSIDVNLASPEKLNYGLKRFYYENVPQLKFKNPHVQFTKNKSNTKESDVVVKFADGREERILTVEKTPSEIMNEISKMTSIKEASEADIQPAGKTEA